jgi:hypothetical protein
MADRNKDKQRSTKHHTENFGIWSKMFEDTKGWSEAANWRRVVNTMADRKKDKQRSTKHHTENFGIWCSVQDI